eukprot:7381901-Prymnesium_polylepis.3
MRGGAGGEFGGDSGHQVLASDTMGGPRAGIWCLRRPSSSCVVSAYPKRSMSLALPRRPASGEARLFPMKRLGLGTSAGRETEPEAFRMPSQ